MDTGGVEDRDMVGIMFPAVLVGPET